MTFERGNLRVEVEPGTGRVTVAATSGLVILSAEEAKWLMWGALSAAVAMIDAHQRRADREAQEAVAPAADDQLEMAMEAENDG